MQEKNLGSIPEDPEDPIKNLKAAEGKNVPHPAPDAGAADEPPGLHTARGRYGEPIENPDAADFYAAPEDGIPKKGVEEA